MFRKKIRFTKDMVRFGNYLGQLGFSFVGESIDGRGLDFECLAESADRDEDWWEQVFELLKVFRYNFCYVHSPDSRGHIACSIVAEHASDCYIKQWKESFMPLS